MNLKKINISLLEFDSKKVKKKAPDNRLDIRGARKKRNGMISHASTASGNTRKKCRTALRPTKHFRLVLWRLLYHLEVQRPLDREDEINACRHARFKLRDLDKGKALWPKEWVKLLTKRKRRLAWFWQHGSIKDGWTPPDPKDPLRTAHKPIHAHLARRGYPVEEFIQKFALVPLERKKGGHHPNWPLILRVASWLKPN